ncbi:MAG: spirocyclase AveC family protein [Mycolicibacterium insubricum]|nr:spirocyclase AveC family protein [Mycobacterium sp.]
MTIQEHEPATGSGDEVVKQSAPKRSLWPFFWLMFAVVIVSLVAHNARTGPQSDRIRNPNVEGNPRPVKPIFGFDHWVTVLEIFTIIACTIIIIVLLIAWRRNPRSPLLMMALITTFIVWQDPIMNWSPFAVYNPDLWHWPEDWPLVSISPTVEPFLVFGYVLFYFGPYFPAVWILRKIQARKPVDSFVWRHPLWSMAGLILVIGFIFDAMLEITLVRTGMYIYSQVPPWGSIFAGDTFQFPLIWESIMVTWVMIPAGILVYRDDTGKTVAEKLAQKARIFPKRPFLGMFIVMFVFINVAYFAYGGGFWLLKVSRVSTSVACPWPYPEAKVYDPQGFYQINGQPGPFSVGKWSTWASAEPGGLDRTELPTGPGRCGPGQ